MKVIIGTSRKTLFIQMRILLFYTILFLCSGLTDSSFLLAQSKDINFFKEFIKIKSISLDKNTVIGNIISLDVSLDKKLLVTDQLSKNVYLFDPKGNLLKIISLENCTPGFHWQPLKAVFTKQENILVINSAPPWGYRFKSDGNCFGEMDVTFLPPSNLAFQSDGSIIGFFNLDMGINLKFIDSKGKEISKFGKIPKDFENLMYRFEGGGLITDEFDNIYHLNVTSPEVIKYDKKGRFIKSFMNKPSYLRRIDRDLSDRNPINNMKEIPKILDGKTISQGLFLFEKNKILVLLSNKDFYGIEIYDLEGNYISKNEIILDRDSNILTAKDGLIYFAHQPDPDKEGNLPNPVIEVYKLK